MMIPLRLWLAPLLSLAAWGAPASAQLIVGVKAGYSSGRTLVDDGTTRWTLKGAFTYGADLGWSLTSQVIAVASVARTGRREAQIGAAVDDVTSTSLGLGARWLFPLLASNRLAVSLHGAFVITRHDFDRLDAFAVPESYSAWAPGFAVGVEGSARIHSNLLVRLQLADGISRYTSTALDGADAVAVATGGSTVPRRWDQEVALYLGLDLEVRLPVVGGR